MNLVERHNIPIRFEDIKVGDKLIVAKDIASEISRFGEPYVGETVTVIHIRTCKQDYMDKRCKIPQAIYCRGICISVTNNLGLITTSCFYSLSSLSRKIIR